MFANPTTILALLALTLTKVSHSAIIKVTALADYDAPDPFMFSPNEITAVEGDIMEFHFAGPGKGVLGGNHSVAQGMWGMPCNPTPGGFWSGYMPVNATSTESDMVFQVPVASTDPIVFYCTQGEHCTRGMHGVLNGAGDYTLQSYRDSIDVNRVGVAPDTVRGGELLPNNVSNIIPAETPGAAGSVQVSIASLVVGLGFALFVAQ